MKLIIDRFSTGDSCSCGNKRDLALLCSGDSYVMWCPCGRVTVFDISNKDAQKQEVYNFNPKERK